MPPKPLKFAILSDVHIGSDFIVDGQVRRLSSRSLGLLRYLVNRMNDEKPAFVVQLGNLIEADDAEEDEDNLSKAIAALKQLTMPLHSVIGSHELSNLNLKQVCKLLNCQRPYYSFDSGPFHFVVLFSEDSNQGIHIDAQQLKWLDEDLRAAQNPTFVFVHHPLDEQDLVETIFENAPEKCFVEERDKVRETLARSGKVCAVFSAHLYRNSLQTLGDIHYVSLQSLVSNISKNGKTPSECFTVVTLGQSEIRVEVEGADPAEYRLSYPTV